MFKRLLLSWCLLIFRSVKKSWSSAEGQKQRIKKLKNEENYKDFLKKKADTRRLSHQKQKENMTEKESEIARLKKRLEMEKHRQRKKEIPV